MMLVALPLCALVLYHVRDSNYETEGVAHVEEVDEEDSDSKAISAPQDVQRKDSGSS
jgi:hypothetical protein